MSGRENCFGWEALTKPKHATAHNISAFIENLVIRSILSTALAVPYRWRVPFVGLVTSHIIAPLAGYRRRIRRNLEYTFPNMARADIDQIVRAVPNNMGRVLIEIFSGQEFVERVRDIPILGDGAKALEQAHTENRPAVLVSGHLGNYEVPRAALIARGYRVGGLYKPMNNPYFAAQFEKAFTEIGKPVFRRGRRGFAEMLRFLRSGGMVGFLVDQYMAHGENLNFFGKPARTAVSAAELALKYDALLVPIYGIRRANGLDFDILVEPPIPHSTASQMTQALNDSLENLVRQHMDQWLWVHRRWKPERQVPHRKRAAAKT